MARRPGDADGFALSPTARRVGGWLVALLLVLGIAVVVRVLGGNGDGSPLAVSPSGSAAPGSVAAIRFGTGIDPSSGEVSAESLTDSFTGGDTFAYSVTPEGTVADPVYVEVLRIDGATEEVLQAPTDAQPLPDPRVIAFRVPADDLLAVFGAGTFVMRIYAEPSGAPLAEGRFELVSGAASPAASP